MLSQVYQAYRDLSDDLRAVGDEQEHDNLEPSELAAERIQRHTSGLRLRQQMDKFLEKLADDLTGKPKTSVVLLPVDDLDLAPTHLFPALRELQAYLLHPRVIPVFTFTDRLSEEILSHQFSTTLPPQKEAQAPRAGKLPVSEQLAIQYLSKCFPIRSRLRLGPSPAMIQIANMLEQRSDSSQTADNGGQRKDLRKSESALLTLVTVSTLLFGTPDRAARHPVRAVLRPSTLRRQFHVIDAMRQAGVRELINDQIADLAKLSQEDRPAYLKKIGPDGRREIPPDGRRGKTPWAVLFDRAVWALMNVHRDVLREYDLHLEDLYSWSPQALRRVLLNALFRCGRTAQQGLWQRWRSLTDSRRSQMISLFAANAHRPWHDEERPSGEELQPVTLWRKKATGESEENQPRDETSPQDTLPASHALLWFLNVALGFYLPLSRSIFREVIHEKEVDKLRGAGWSLDNAPILAAQIADDDRKPFPTGMLFLDPFTYAIALTTVPRIAACRHLDNHEGPSEEEHQATKKAKVILLSTRTPDALKELQHRLGEIDASDEEFIKKLHDEYKATAAWEHAEPEFSRSDFTQRVEEIEKFIANRDHAKSLKYAQALANDLPDEESTKKLLEAVAELHKGATPEKWQLASEEVKLARNGVRVIEEVVMENGMSVRELVKKIKRRIKERDYAKAQDLAAALEQGDLPVPVRDLKVAVDIRAAAASAVHDDQLLLRIWTCYGFNRGRYWTAVSLWRGLGLLGQLIEFHRSWREHRPPQQDRPLYGVERAEAKEKYDVYIKKLTGRIAGVIRTHSLKGLVPGIFLGQPHEGTLELAFSGWDTRGQRQATWRLAHRLALWLDEADESPLKPLQSSSEAFWGRCFVRRLHGDYVAGSLWPWLDAEYLENQGDQYGGRKRFFWNANVALTSWLRVLLRYFKGAYEVRWLLETCPLASPFLSRSAHDPLLAKLREESYDTILGNPRKGDGEEDRASAINPESRDPERFRTASKALKSLWQADVWQKNKEDKENQEDVVGDEESAEEDCGGIDPRFRLLFVEKLGIQRLDVAVQSSGIDRARAVQGTKVLLEKLIFGIGQSGLAGVPIFRTMKESRREHIRQLESSAAALRNLLLAEDGNELYRLRRDLLETFLPKVETQGGRGSKREEDEDMLDPQSIAYEFASMIYQHWKVAAHASAASLFYQIPRVRRSDFFGTSLKDGTHQDEHAE